MSGQQKALWLKEAKGELAVGPKAIDKPGSGELLVKVEATALNPVSAQVKACTYGPHPCIRWIGRSKSSLSAFRCVTSSIIHEFNL
jgi:hypothetical protein